LGHGSAFLLLGLHTPVATMTLSFFAELSEHYL
jgi:hypothetical protein